MKTITYLLLIFVLLPTLPFFSRTDAGIKIIPWQGGLHNEVKKLNNPYTLLLPYSIGIILNGYASSQSAAVSDWSVGINDTHGSIVIPNTSPDDIVGLSEVKVIEKYAHTYKNRCFIYY